MESAIVAKLQRLARRGPDISEDEVRSFAVLVRKRLEMMPDITPYVTLNLFCNWAVHISITKSLTGLRTLARVNDALVAQPRDANVDIERLIRDVTAAIGFTTLRAELI